MVRYFGRKILYFSGSWLGKLAIAIISVIPPGLLTFVKESKTAKFFPQAIIDLYQNTGWLEVVVVFWPVLIVCCILILESIRTWINGREPDAKVLINMIFQLGSTVGLKSEKTYNKTANFLNGSNDPGEQISARDQIEELIKNIWHIFDEEAKREGAQPEQQIKVTLAKLNQNGIFSSFVSYLPYNAVPLAEEKLRNRKTAFTFAYDKKGIIVIEDIGKELKKPYEARYYTETNDNGKTGSIICYPIRIRRLSNHSEIPLVISIKSDEAKIFKQFKRNRYEFFIKPFAERICLEYYNAVLLREDL